MTGSTVKVEERHREMAHDVSLRGMLRLLPEEEAHLAFAFAEQEQAVHDAAYRECHNHWLQACGFSIVATPEEVIAQVRGKVEAQTREECARLVEQPTGHYQVGQTKQPYWDGVKLAAALRAREPRKGAGEGHKYQPTGSGRCGYYVGGDPEQEWSYCCLPRTDSEHLPPTPLSEPPPVKPLSPRTVPAFVSQDYVTDAVQPEPPPPSEQETLAEARATKDMWKERYQQSEERWSILKERERRLVEALRGLLLSMDASWEVNHGGHDWPEAVAAARRVLDEVEAKG